MLHARFHAQKDHGAGRLNTFTLHLQSSDRHETIADVVSFVGTDASGAFGLMAGHERMMTVLDFGLARFRINEGSWQFLAFPGGLLYFVDNALYICAHSFVHSDEYSTATAAISGILRREEEGLRGLRNSIGRMEKEMIRQLWELRREET